MVSCQHYFASVVQGKIKLQKLSTLPNTHFLSELTFLSQNWYFFRKVKSSLEVQRVKENFQTILVIIFWHFLIIQLRSESPQVKGFLTSVLTSLVLNLLHELQNDLKLKGCVRYICAGLFFKSKQKHLSNQEKCVLFHFKSSFRS